MIEWPQAEHIYLSPHLDDVVLSCGGMIAMQARDGARVAIITVCAGSPAGNLPDTPIVRELHERWEASGIDAPAMRRAEDVRATKALGETVEAVHWEYLDCIYRRDPGTGDPLYPTNDYLNAEIQPGDPLLADLFRAAPLPKGAKVYIPLGVGRHVDHQVVHRAASGWNIAPEQMEFYEDYPYAGRAGAIEAVTEDRGWVSRAVALDEEALAAKIRGIAAHESQISSFWPSLAAMETALREFAALRGGERLWVRTPTAG